MIRTLTGFFIGTIFFSFAGTAAASSVAKMTAAGTLPLSCGVITVAIGGDFQITLPAATSTDGCDIYIVDGDGNSGKYLVGFPDDINPKLYPHQFVAVTSLDGSWITISKPGRWKMPGGMKILVDNNGSDTNDGISKPLKHLSTATQVAQVDFDIAQSAPIIAPTVGQTFINDALALGGQPTGGNLIQFSPNGNGTVYLVNSGPCIVVGDNAELDIRANAFGPNGAFDLTCNTANAAQNGHIYQHNNGLFDVEGSLVFHGAGLNDNAFFFDGPAMGASFNGTATMFGTFDSFFRMDEGGGRFTIGCSSSPGCPNFTSGNNQTFANHMFIILGANELLLSAPLGGGYASLGYSIVGGQAQIVTSGISIPGGYATRQSGRVDATKY